MLFKDWLVKECNNRKNKAEILNGKMTLFSELVCNDGLSLLVQASRCHMCSPRETLEDGSEYEEVEVYSHGEYILDLTRYATESDFTYGYVPVKIMEELIEKHGGIKEN